MKTGDRVRTPHGPGRIVQFETVETRGETGKPSQRTFILVQLDDTGRRWPYPPAQVTPEDKL